MALAVAGRGADPNDLAAYLQSLPYIVVWGNGSEKP